jgi:hypothetical protein
MIASDRDVLDLIGEALGVGASLVVVPAERLGDDFFQLRTRFAGEMTQKLVNYRLGLAIVGDVSRHVDASSAFRDFVYECNRGSQIWFLPDLEAVMKRLEQARHNDA